MGRAELACGSCSLSSYRHLPPPASVKRVRDKYEVELSELEQSERRLQERCTELKGRLGEAEGEKEHLQSLVRQKEKELEDVRAVSSLRPLPHEPSILAARSQPPLPPR